MYIVSNEITVTWVLGPTDAPLTAADYDINIVPSTLGATYTDAGIVNYVAPTAISAGSLQYLFTPLSAGRYRLYLTTGTNLSYTILDEKDFWVFLEAPVSANSLKVLGAVSYPAPKLFVTDTAPWGDINWYRLNAVAYDESTQEILTVGLRAFADGSGTLQIASKDGQTFTNYMTLPMTDPDNVTRDPTSGRVYVSKASQVANNEYAVYYSDSPYTTWTRCTSPLNRFSGNHVLTYDSYQDKIWWGMSTRLFVADAGSDTFYKQQFDVLGAGSAADCSESKWWHRFKDQWYAGGSTLGGSWAGQERFYRGVGNASAATPNNYLDVLDMNDLWGASYLSQDPRGMANSVDGDKTLIFGVGGTNSIQLISSDGVTFGSPVDLAVEMPNVVTFYNMFSVPAFGKLYMLNNQTAGVTMYESDDDGANWITSTDIRWTPYIFSVDESESKFALMEDVGGVVLIDNSPNPGFRARLIITV